MGESEKKISIFLRGWYWVKYKIHAAIKFSILNLFYRGYYDPRMQKIHVGRVMTIFFFQKMLVSCEMCVIKRERCHEGKHFC